MKTNDNSISDMALTSRVSMTSRYAMSRHICLLGYSYMKAIYVKSFQKSEPTGQGT